MEEAQGRVKSSAFSEWKLYRLIEPSNPPVSAWQLALCTSAIVNALGGESEPADFMVKPFEHLYREALIDGDLDDDDCDYVTTEPPEPKEKKRRPIVDLDS